MPLTAGQILKRIRLARGLTTRQVASDLKSDRINISAPTISRIENDSLQIGEDRLRVLLAYYDLPSYLASDLEDLFIHTSNDYSASSLQEMYEEAKSSWQSGEFEHSLDLWIQMKIRLIELQAKNEADGVDRDFCDRITFLFAIAARNIGKLNLARSILEDLDIESASIQLQVRYLLAIASIHREQSQFLYARALLKHAIKICPQDYDHGRGWIHHELSAVELTSMNYEKALNHASLAEQNYLEVGDKSNKVGLLITKVQAYMELGSLREAERLGEIALNTAMEENIKRHISYAKLRLGQVKYRRNDIREAKLLISAAIKDGSLMKDFDLLFYAYHAQWLIDQKPDSARLAIEASRELDCFTPQIKAAIAEMATAHEEQP